MFYGITPFYSNSLKETYSKIQSIDFQFEEGISDEFKDLISNLICRKEIRYGFEEIKTHSFFKEIDWDNLRKLDPPFKPHVSNDDDISNFVDTDFSPDTSAAKSGFLNFIGFTHDPDHVSNILSSIVESYNVISNKSSGSSVAQIDRVVSNDSVCKSCDDDGTTVSGAVMEIEGHPSEKAKLSEITKTIQCKINELSDLTNMVNELQSNKYELSSQLSSLNQCLQGTLDQISVKKAVLEQIQTEIKMAKEHLQQIRTDIVEKLGVASSDRSEGINIAGIAEDLKDIKKSIERFKFTDRLDEIKETAYWLYKQNQNLSNEIIASSQKENENKSLEDLKKQLRMQKSEIREYEQKIENELVLRRKLEEEIKVLKKSLKEASRSFNNFVVKTVNALSNKEVEISIENGTMKVDSKEYLINTVFVRELKNNELHHLSEKRRSLSLQMFFLKEPVGCSSGSGSRRSLKALETDLEKEEKIRKGLRDLLVVLEGKSKEEAELQMKGSLKKIEELKIEIERAKKSTIVDSCIDDCEKVYEFKSHLFYETTVAKGTLCEHCNEVLYGIVNQAYCCRDCLLVVHKSCYILVDVSCELNKAIRCGTSIPIICKTVEDKDKLLKLNRVM
ncbi:AGC/DMPK protein kinase [Vittaforma corneae ATCC 50505]|uniref:non-specific serine/threonine protein kinase n=1 Tax=Vittaforma corneae (strain ATCC 50505) TaxID=993615 RepID=L2GPM0_VITCO|nr:AGC/DMPK protein kinase [Vittaforma corneae ATCC 50505]ELA42554.1 AGC/DMPK protein kinase [Vittaforma corneae ATCC 50505]